MSACSSVCLQKVRSGRRRGVERQRVQRLPPILLWCGAQARRITTGASLSPLPSFFWSVVAFSFSRSIRVYSARLVATRIKQQIFIPPVKTLIPFSDFPFIKIPPFYPYFPSYASTRRRSFFSLSLRQQTKRPPPSFRQPLCFDPAQILYRNQRLVPLHPILSRHRQRLSPPHDALHSGASPPAISFSIVHFSMFSPSEGFWSFDFI